MQRTLFMLLLAGTSALATGAAQAQGTETLAVEEVIVTAQRRAENIQDTPLTVQALTADTIAAAGALDTADLATLVPNVTFNSNLTAATPYVRGIGQNTGSLGVESPVAIYIDGVYLVAPASGLFALNNIERVEVLKGPQGTLFGRNATGGVIQVITREPSQAFDWNASVGFSRFETYSASAYVTGAVAPNLSTSLSAFIEDQNEGFIKNVFLNKKLGRSEDYAIQNKWLWQPTEATDVGLNLMYIWKYGFLGTTRGVYPGHVADDRVTTFLGDYVTSAAIPTQNRDSQALAALTVRHDLGWARITNILSWHQLWDRFNFVQNAEPIHTPFLPGRGSVVQYIFGDQETRTEEFQLQSPAESRLAWTLGFYYLYDKTRLAVLDTREGQFISQGGNAAQIVGVQKTESYAGYVDGSYNILPDTRLTLGLRYTKDKKAVDGRSVSITPTGALAVSTPAAPAPGFAPLQTPTSWDEWTYRAVLDHHFTPDIMAYASYNRGFKSGLYNITFFLNQPVDPEIVNAYEVGLKSQLFENRLRVNAAVFYYDYKGLQLRSTSSAFPGRFLLFNAASSTIKGLDIDFTAVPARGLTLRGGLGLLDAEYEKFPSAPFGLPNPVTLPLPAGCTVVGALPPAAAFVGGNTTVSCDASGRRMPRSPTMTANLGMTYEMGLDGGSALRFNIDDAYNSGFFWDPDHDLHQGSFHDLRASLTWTSPSGKMDVMVWGNNLLDEVVYTTAGTGATSTFGVDEPRKYGITLRIRH